MNNTDWKIASLRTEITGHSIRYGLWSPSEKFSNLLIYLNGRSEWIEKNSELPFDLKLPDNCAMLALDHHGQGGSDGLRGHIHSYDEYVDDLIHLVEKLGLKQMPCGIISHSMGGLIGLYGIAMSKLDPKFIILSSPLLGLPRKPLPPFLARIVIKLVMQFGGKKLRLHIAKVKPKKLEDNRLTHSEKYFKKIKMNPYELPGPTFSWLAATMNACAEVLRPKNMASYQTPTLIFFPSEEEIVDLNVSKNWAEQILALNIKGTPFEIVEIKGSFHEVFSETPEFRDRALKKAQYFISQFF